jgi:uncharacterized protein (TIGR00288 family)
MTIDRVMLLIDADNVSVDVMDQAVRLLLKQHGGLHVRRAYCTAESAVKHQTVFKHLGIKPMVNLAAGKNSTDIALAVDAIDLVLAERPDVVVIASSDSDFAPLVHRLREKGCVVRGIGQSGKTGDETQGVYDDFTVLEHRKGTAEGEAKPARKTPARKAATKTAAKSGCGQEDPGRQEGARHQDGRRQDPAQDRHAQDRGAQAGETAAAPEVEAVVQAPPRRHSARRAHRSPFTPCQPGRQDHGAGRAGLPARTGRRPEPGAERGRAAPARGAAVGQEQLFAEAVLATVGSL